VGTAVTVGERCRWGPIRRAGVTAAHAEGPRVVAKGRGRPYSGDERHVGGRAWRTRRPPAHGGLRR
jgi:hypothetical protein